MAQISPDLLQSEWDTYNGLKNFLKNKEHSFAEDMNKKYQFRDDKLIQLSDWDAYNYIKNKHVIDIENMK